MSGARFHPVVARWFAGRFAEPTEPQALAWPLIQAGKDVLIAAPTGSGKTFAAFLAAIDDLVRQGLDGTLSEGIQVVSGFTNRLMEFAANSGVFCGLASFPDSRPPVRIIFRN